MAIHPILVPVALFAATKVAGLVVLIATPKHKRAALIKNARTVVRKVVRKPRRPSGGEGQG